MAQRSSTRLAAAASVGLLVLSQASLAWACPVCFSAKNEENQIAYLITTGFLSFLPLIFIGGMVLWIWRRAVALQEPQPEVPVHRAGLSAVESDPR